MKLTVFNGSPKKGKSNTEILVNKFIDGFKIAKGNNYEIYKLKDFSNLKNAAKYLEKSEYILLAFPLYNYSMPAVVKKFIEELEPYCRNKKIGYLIQYGFPEAIHARGIEKYLEKLTMMLNFEYLGTIIKGGCNNLTNTSQPFLYLNKKTFNGIYNIGKKFGEEGKFDKIFINKYSRPEKSNLLLKIQMKMIVKIVNKHYWSEELKKNGVFETSFAQPYQK